MSFGVLILFARLDLGYPRQRVAARARISSSNLGLWETGKRRPVQKLDQVIPRLAQVLEIPEADLWAALEEEGEVRNPNRYCRSGKHYLQADTSQQGRTQKKPHWRFCAECAVEFRNDLSDPRHGVKSQGYTYWGCRCERCRKSHNEYKNLYRKKKPPGWKSGRCTWVEAFGEIKSIGEWAQDHRCRVARGTIGIRLKVGWSPEEAISLPAAHARRPARRVPLICRWCVGSFTSKRPDAQYCSSRCKQAAAYERLKTA